ncbi:MAG TPA: NCS2 family permease [Thermomicrobiales bacterium]|nr:NCS2 family permease [Thermomicrobiales bacterium]
MQGVGQIPTRPGGADPATRLDRMFRLSENGTTARGEVAAGTTTFMVMAYIIAVNPAILAAAGLDTRAVATSTCLVAGVMTLAMGLVTNRAFAMAPGLGLNAIVAFSLVGALGLTPAEAMGVVVTEGLLITVLVLIGVRKWVMDAVPDSLARAISVGIGLFILFIGLRNAGLILFLPGQTGSVDGFLALAPLNTWPIAVAILGLVVTLVLMARGFRPAILVGIVVATLAALVVPGQVATLPAEPFAGPDFSLIGQVGFGYWAKLGFLTAFLSVVSLMLSDFFDTMGTLIGVGAEAGYLNQRGELPGAQKALLVDSLGAVAGGFASASSATTFIESAAGIATGGRTGLVSVVTGLLFLASLPFVNLVTAIPAAATAPALIVVGALMVGVLSERRGGGAIDFRDIGVGVPVVLTMLVMPLTFSITNGIGAGFVAYALIAVARGRLRDLHPAVAAVAVLFVDYFARHALFAVAF